MTASIAEEAMTVEIVVGANDAAGIAEVPNAAEVENPASPNALQPDTKEKRELPLTEREMPSAPQEAERSTEPMVAPSEEPIAPIQREISPRQQKVEEPPAPEPAERPRPMPNRSTASPASAHGVGRGRLAGEANYQGLVATRLARYKRFPPEARNRRQQGSAIVSFDIDPTGRVTSVRLVRKTGFAALDNEVEAMVWRASPFPAPPTGVALTFSAPISFHLN